MTASALMMVLITVVAVATIPYLLPIVMRRWEWSLPLFAFCVAFLSMLFAGMWFDWIGRGYEGLGMSLNLMLLWSLVLGLVVRIYFAWLDRLGRPAWRKLLFGAAGWLMATWPLPLIDMTL